MASIVAYSGLVFSAECQWSSKNKTRFVLSYDLAKTEIQTDTSGARIKKCERWKDFPQLLIAEISLGAVGTTSLSEETDLFIFEIKETELVQKYRLKILEETRSKDPETHTETKDQVQYPYALQKTKEGKPAVQIATQTEWIVLQ